MPKEEFLKLKPEKFALSAAIIWSIIFLLISLIGTYSPFGRFSKLTNLMLGIYGGFGYSLTLIGSFIGAIFAFIDSFIIVWIFAWLYNKLLVK